MAVDKILEYFEIHNLFPDLQQIKAISTGIIGDDIIDCYKAFDVGIELRKQ